MVGRVATFQVQADKVDEVIAVAKQAIAVVTERRPPGYQGYLSMVDRGSGKCVSIQLWDTEADATAFTTSPLFRELMGPMMPLLVEAPVSAIYEVAAQA